MRYASPPLTPAGRASPSVLIHRLHQGLPQHPLLDLFKLPTVARQVEDVDCRLSLRIHQRHLDIAPLRPPASGSARCSNPVVSCVTTSPATYCCEDAPHRQNSTRVSTNTSGAIPSSPPPSAQRRLLNRNRPRHHIVHTLFTNASCSDAFHLQCPKVIGKAERIHHHTLAVRKRVGGNDIHPPSRQHARHRRKQLRPVPRHQRQLAHHR